MPPGTSAVASQIPLSEEQLDEFARAFQRDAREHGLSPERVHLFEAWTLAFLSWCAGEASGLDSPDRLSSCRIGEFQVSLRGQPETSQTDALKAMDALAFLFGAAQETKSMLRSVGFAVEGLSSQKSQDVAESAPSERIRTLDVGWRDEGEPEDDEAARRSDRFQDPVPKKGASAERGASISRPTSQEDASSTAKAFVRAYQSELESLHPSDSSSAQEGKMQSARAQ